MNFCNNCGAKLIRLKTDDSWIARWRCDHCGTRYELTYGDAMGGSSDVIHERHKPFGENEEVKQ